MNIGKTIAEQRKLLSYSQQQLADKISVSRSAVAKWENNKGVPDIENIKALSALFHISIDSFLENERASVKIFSDKMDSEKNARFTKRDEKIQNFISKKCTVDVKAWNDGIYDGYLIAQDSVFLYYLTMRKREVTIGALAKDMITEIIVSTEKEKYPVDLALYQHINRDFFINKRVNIELYDKHIWNGLFGKEIEYSDVILLAVTMDQVIIEVDNVLNDITLSLDEVVKFEVNA